MPFVKVKTGAKLHYEVKGKGEPAIVIHGFMGTARAEMGKVIDWVSNTHTTYGITLRGYGLSEPIPRHFPNDFYYKDTNDIIAFMDALGIEKAHYLGFSDGGEIGLIAGGKYPERFQSITVWGALGFFGKQLLPELDKYYPPTWLTEKVKQRHSIPDANAMVKEWVEAIRYMVNSGGDVSLHLADKLKAPLLMMLGTKDYLNPEKYARRFLEKAGHGTLHMVECGHPIHDEAWTEFTALVGPFLKKHTSIKSVMLKDFPVLPTLPVAGIWSLYKRKVAVSKKENNLK